MVDPIELTVLAVVLSVVSTTVGVLQLLRSSSFNLTSRARWLEYIAHRVPRFKDFFDIIDVDRLRRRNRRITATPWALVPMLTGATSPLLLGFTNLLKPIPAATADAILMATGLLVVILGNLLYRRSLLGFIGKPANLRPLAIADSLERLDPDSKRVAIAFASLDLQGTLLWVSMVEPSLFLWLFLLASFAQPLGDILALVVGVTLLAIAIHLIQLSVASRYAAEDAMFVAMMIGSPPLVVRVDVLLKGGGQFANEDLVGVGDAITLRNSDLREIELPWNRIEAIGFRLGHPRK